MCHCRQVGAAIVPKAGSGASEREQGSNAIPSDKEVRDGGRSSGDRALPMHTKAKGWCEAFSGSF